MNTSFSSLDRFLTEKLIRFADEEGILRLLKAMRQFDMEEVLEAFQSEIGYQLQNKTRSRMIRVLIDLLCECAYLRVNEGRFGWSADDAFCDSLSEDEFRTLKSNFRGEMDFFEQCIGYASTFLKGGRELYGFDKKSKLIWENFLGNYEFRFARSVLIGILFSGEDVQSGNRCSVLDLCSGPGFDIVQMKERFPSLKVTALDFKDTFYECAYGKLHDKDSVNWIDPVLWNGFGTPLPFDDQTFDNVFFACADPYIPAQLRESVYTDIHRILKHGGSLGILTRSYPDASRLYVKDPWARRVVYCHDFSESVCEGWQGFCDAQEAITLFKKIGYSVQTVMLNSSVWRLDKR